jgi:P27 family predicted phage terminase small subunit
MSSKRKIPNPPAHLTAQTKRWWREVTTLFELEPHHLKLLQGAAEAWDRCQQAREILKADGLILTDRFEQKKLHPAALVERDAKTLFAKLIRELAFDVPQPDSRPPRAGGAKY